MPEPPDSWRGATTRAPVSRTSFEAGVLVIGIERYSHLHPGHLDKARNVVSISMPKSKKKPGKKPPQSPTKKEEEPDEP